jgi:hypothetical protein
MSAEVVVLSGESYDDIAGMLAFDEGALAIVYNDPIVANNAVWVKSGASGVGTWERSAFVTQDQVYVPDQSQFPGSIALGAGLRNLVHINTEQGYDNTTIGHEAGLSLTSGWGNTLIGPSAGRSLSASTISNTFSGSLGNVGNTLIGRNCAPIANGALDNTLVGTNAGLNLTTGMDNAGLGINALNAIESGSENAAVGHGALQHILGTSTFSEGTGHRLSAFGDMAGRYMNDGERKTGGKCSVYVGARTSSLNSSAINESVYGYEAKGRGSNTAVYGNAEVTGHYLPGGGLFIEDCADETSELPNAYIDPESGEVRRSTAVDWTWQDWQPAFTTSLSGTISALNLQARYFKVGKKVTIRLSFQVNGTGTGFIGVTLPFAAAGPCAFSAVEDTTAGIMAALVRTYEAPTYAKITIAHPSFTTGISFNGRRFVVSGDYEIA